MLMKKVILACCVVCLCAPNTVRAQLTRLGHFEGHEHENFTSLVGTPIHVPSVLVFEETVEITNLTEGGSIFVAPGSSLGGDEVSAYSSPLAIAQLGISQWVFETPVVRFGAFFENNSRFDDAVLEFYDSNDEWIDSVVAIVPEDGQSWVWNGWESGIPIRRMVCMGNDQGFLNGFIWFDDVEISYPYSAGDINRDELVNLLDVSHFVNRLVTGSFQIEADLNRDGSVDLLDVSLFIDALEK